MKRMLCVVVVLCILISLFTFHTSASVSKYEYSNLNNCNDIKLINDNNCIYACGYKGENFYLNRIMPDDYTITLSCEKNITEYSVKNGYVYLLCKDGYRDSQYLYIYDIASDNLQYLVFDFCSADICNSFAVIGKSIFFVDENNYRIISEFSTKGAYKNRYTLSQNIQSLATNSNNDIFAFTLDGVYKKSNNNFTYVSEPIILPVDFIDSDIMINAYGDVFSDFYFVTSSLYESFYPSGGIIDGIIYMPNSDRIVGYSLSDSQEKYSYNLKASQVRAYRGNIIALNRSMVYIIPQSSFEYTAEDASQNIIPRGRTSDDTPVSYSFSTDYTLDNDKMQIRDIEPSTNITQFRSHFNAEGYTITVYKANGDKLSGSNVGTAMTAVIENDYERYEYELSVNGDITGEGNLNTRDRDELSSYLFGKTNFDGVYFCSADLNNDSRIDSVDMVLLLRKM